MPTLISEYAKNKKLDIVEFYDAFPGKKNFLIEVTSPDIEKGVPGSAEECAAAQAVLRRHKQYLPFFFGSTTYLEERKATGGRKRPRIIRCRNTAKTRRELVIFDHAAALVKPVTLELVGWPKSQTLREVQKRSRKKRNGCGVDCKPNPKRKIHRRGVHLRPVNFLSKTK